MAATLPEVAGGRRFPSEPPANIPTLVTAFSGWIDAGEAATDAMRFLVRQLAAANRLPRLTWRISSILPKIGRSCA
jgi:hypothetical protein